MVSSNKTDLCLNSIFFSCSRIYSLFWVLPHDMIKDSHQNFFIIAANIFKVLFNINFPNFYCIFIVLYNFIDCNRKFIKKKRKKRLIYAILDLIFSFFTPRFPYGVQTKCSPTIYCCILCSLPLYKVFLKFL